jgi:hypothetical protein
MGAFLLRMVLVVVLVGKTAVFLILIAFRVCVQPFFYVIVLYWLLEVQVADVYSIDYCWI